MLSLADVRLNRLPAGACSEMTIEQMATWPLYIFCVCQCVSVGSKMLMPMHQGVKLASDMMTRQKVFHNSIPQGSF